MAKPAKRIDPTSRPADGRRAHDGLRNYDPTRHYVWVNPNDDLGGVEAYRANGYVLEHKTTDGVYAAVGKTVAEGDVITSMGQMLMSCAAEVKADLDLQVEQMAATFERKIRAGGVESGVSGNHGEGGRWGAQVKVDPNADGKPTTEFGA